MALPLEAGTFLGRRHLWCRCWGVAPLELLSFSPGSREPGRTSPLPPMPPSWDLRAWAGSRQCGPLPPPSPRKAESTAGPCGGVVPKAPSPCPCAEEGPGEPGPTAGKHANKWGFLSAVTLPEGIARTATPMHHQDCESHTGWNEDSQARDQHSPGGGHACWSEKWRKLQRQCWVGGPVWAGGVLERHRESQSMRLGGP